MIKNTKQDWSIGKTVKVGFLSLRITDIVPIKDGLPDIYKMVSDKTGKTYEFVPHHGLCEV